MKYTAARILIWGQLLQEAGVLNLDIFCLVTKNSGKKKEKLPVNINEVTFGDGIGRQIKDEFHLVSQGLHITQSP